MFSVILLALVKQCIDDLMFSNRVFLASLQTDRFFPPMHLLRKRLRLKKPDCFFKGIFPKTSRPGRMRAVWDFFANLQGSVQNIILCIFVGQLGIVNM